MKLYKILILFLTIILCINVYATDTNSVVSVSDYSNIQAILDDIKYEINGIDNKIKRSKILEEFEKYPAIRLNIDTPFFGLTSVVNSKLKINNTSIRDIIINNEIMIDNKTVYIDNKLNEKYVNITTIKLLEYLEQARSVNNFLDKQLYYIYKGFFLTDKLEYISNINSNLKEIGLQLTKIDKLVSNKKLDTKIYLDYISCINRLYKFKSKSKNINLTYNELEILFNDVIEFKKEVDILNNKYINYVDINQDEYLNYIKESMSQKLIYFEKYINDSKTLDKKEIYKIDDDRILNSMKEDSKLLLNESNVVLYKENIDDFSKSYCSFLKKENIYLSDNIKLNIVNLKNNKEKLNIEQLIYVYNKASDKLKYISNIYKSDNYLINKYVNSELLNILNELIEISKDINDDKVS